MRKQNIAANLHKYRCLENILFDDAGFDDARRAGNHGNNDDATDVDSQPLLSH